LGTCSSGRKLTEPERLRNGYDAGMRILFYCGVILVAMSLLAAAFETAAHGLFGANQGFIMSAHDLWYALRPKSLLVFEIRTERIARWLWNPVMTTLLIFPAWAVFGVPGGLLLWFCHPHRGRQDDDDDVKGVLESFELFNELTRQALRDNPKGEEHGPRDMLPDDLIGQDIAPDANRPGEVIDNDDLFDSDGGDGWRQ